MTLADRTTQETKIKVLPNCKADAVASDNENLIIEDEDLTFIIAIQAEDSIIVSSDTLDFKLDSGFQIRPNHKTPIKKMKIWQSGIFASNGIDLIGHRVFNQLYKYGDVDSVQKWLINSANQVTRQLGKAHPVLLKQIDCTKIYCSYLTPQRPQLRCISQTYDETFEINGLRIMTYQKDISAILPLLRSLQQNIKPKIEFADNMNWMQYYVEYFQSIFYAMNRADDWVSQDFHVYFETCTDRFFGYTSNQENGRIVFDI